LSYASLRRTLNAMRNEVFLTTPIRTLAELDPAQRQARLVMDSDGAGHPGDPVALAPELLEPLVWIFEDGVARYTRVYHTSTGAWITAFAPVRDASLKTMAVLDVDFRADMYLAQLQAVKRRLYLHSLVAAVLALAAIPAASGQLPATPRSLPSYTVPNAPGSIRVPSPLSRPPERPEARSYEQLVTLWKQAGVEPQAGWYIESGQGMGATLGIADDRKAYTLTDRGTYLAFQKRVRLPILLEGDRPLLNIYSVMEVNPGNGPRINTVGGHVFADFMVSSDVQKIIKTFGVAKYGQPLFVPVAGMKEDEVGGKD